MTPDPLATSTLAMLPGAATLPGVASNDEIGVEAGPAVRRPSPRESRTTG